jgi:mannitol-1-/sugar-/sorbitol-6-phosphatase
MTQFEVSAVLFDMDGTLVDSTAIVERTWTTWANKNGLDPEFIVRFAHGRPTADTIRETAPHLDAVREAGTLLAEEELDPSVSVNIAGALEAVNAAQKYAKWAVVTSASRRLALLRLEAGGFPDPPVLVTADDIVRGKPDPEGFRMAAHILGISPEECLVFEDTPAGLLAAAAAGAAAIGLTTTFPARDLPCAVIVPDLLSVRFEALAHKRLRVSVIPRD